MADEYTPTSWVDGVPPYIDAEHLNKIEAELVRLGTQLAAIKAAYLGKSAISNVQVNDQNKVPSSALVYGMNEDISVLNSNFNGYKIIATPEEIGCSQSSTLEEVALALPNKSIATFVLQGPSDSNEMTISPGESRHYVFAVKTETISTYVLFLGFRGTGNVSDMYVARYASSAGTKMVGWKKIAFA